MEDLRGQQRRIGIRGAIIQELSRRDVVYKPCARRCYLSEINNVHIITITNDQRFPSDY